MKLKNALIKYLIIANLIVLPTIVEPVINYGFFEKEIIKKIDEIKPKIKIIREKEPKKTSLILGPYKQLKRKNEKLDYLLFQEAEKDSLNYSDFLNEYAEELKEKTKIKEETKFYSRPIKREHRDICRAISAWKKRLNEKLSRDDSLFNNSLETEKEPYFSKRDFQNKLEKELEGTLSLPKDVFEIIQEKKKNPKFKNWNKKYYILSKTTNELFLFDNFHELMGKTPILRGEELGDNWNRNSKNTPSGKGSIFYVEKDLDIYGSFSTPFYRIRYSHLQDTLMGIGIHGIPLLEYDDRIIKLKSVNTGDNLSTKGCINCNRAWLLKHEPFAGDSIFISTEPVIIGIKEILKIPEMKNIYMQFLLDQYETSKTKHERKEKISFAYR